MDDRLTSQWTPSNWTAPGSPHSRGISPRRNASKIRVRADSTQIDDTAPDPAPAPVLSPAPAQVPVVSLGTVETAQFEETVAPRSDVKCASVPIAHTGPSPTSVLMPTEIDPAPDPPIVRSLTWRRLTLSDNDQVSDGRLADEDDDNEPHNVDEDEPHNARCELGHGAGGDESKLEQDAAAGPSNIVPVSAKSGADMETAAMAGCDAIWNEYSSADNHRAETFAPIRKDPQNSRKDLTPIVSPAAMRSGPKRTRTLNPYHQRFSLKVVANKVIQNRMTAGLRTNYQEVAAVKCGAQDTAKGRSGIAQQYTGATPGGRARTQTFLFI